MKSVVSGTSSCSSTCSPPPEFQPPGILFFSFLKDLSSCRVPTSSGLDGVGSPAWLGHMSCPFSSRLIRLSLSLPSLGRDSPGVSFLLSCAFLRNDVFVVTRFGFFAYCSPQPFLLRIPLFLPPPPLLIPDWYAVGNKFSWFSLGAILHSLFAQIVFLCPSSLD